MQQLHGLGVGDAAKVGVKHVLQALQQALVHKLVEHLQLIGALFHNGVDDLFNSVGGNHYEFSPVFIDTIDALIQYLPYQRITVPNSVRYNQVRNLISERIEGCVKEVYTTEEWSVNPAEIENAKHLMINKEPRLEELFKFFEIVNKGN